MHVYGSWNLFTMLFCRFVLAFCVVSLVMGCDTNSLPHANPADPRVRYAEHSKNMQFPDLESIVGEHLDSCQELLELNPVMCIRGSGQWKQVRSGREHFSSGKYPGVCIEIYWSKDDSGRRIIRDANICQSQ